VAPGGIDGRLQIPELRQLTPYQPFAEFDLASVSGTGNMMTVAPRPVIQASSPGGGMRQNRRPLRSLDVVP
jgi:hypothetical protein